MSDFPHAILVIEDDDDVRFAIQTALEFEGYAIKTAKNGQDALDRIESDGMPELILLDMKMPVMDGWQFSKEYRRRYPSGAPIVVMTAAADAKKRADQIQSQGWIEKPVALEILFAEVAKNLPRQ